MPAPLPHPRPPEGLTTTPLRPSRPRSLVRRADRSIEAAMAPLRGRPVPDALFYGLSAVGDHGIIWHGVAGTLALRGRTDEAVRLVAAIALESLIVNVGIKDLFRRSRPVALVGHTRRLRVPRTSSFPSGHASSAFCGARLLAAGRPSVVAGGWYLLAALLAASRVHVRVHHPSDVVAGAAVGWALGEAALRLWPLPGHDGSAAAAVRPLQSEAHPPTES